MTPNPGPVAVPAPAPAPGSGTQHLWTIIGGRRSSSEERSLRAKTPAHHPDFTTATQRPLVWLEEHSLSRTALVLLPRESLRCSLDVNPDLVDQLVARHLRSSVPPAQRLGELLEQHLRTLDQIFFYGNLTRHGCRGAAAPGFGQGFPAGGGTTMRLQWRGSSREKRQQQHQPPHYRQQRYLMPASMLLLQQQQQQRPLVQLRVEDRGDQHNVITYYDGERRTIHVSAAAGPTPPPRRRDELLGLLVYHMARAYLDIFSSASAPQGGSRSPAGQDGQDGGGGGGYEMAWEIEVFMLETIAGWFEEFKTRIMEDGHVVTWGERQQQQLQQQQQQQQQQQHQSAEADRDEDASPSGTLPDSYAGNRDTPPDIEAYWDIERVQ